MCVAANNVVKPDSGVWCIGSNKYGQLGNGNCVDQSVWQGYLNFGGETVSRGMGKEVEYQMNSTAMISTDGNVWAWGDNTYGKLGTGGPLQICNPTPARVQLPSGVKAITLSGSDEYTMYILGDNGKVYAMGRNHNGQLGDGTTTNRSVPVEVKLPRQETIY